jgi:hypothetical protein
MKNLTLILLLIPSLALCQADLDSLRKEVLTIKAEQQNIKLNLEKSHLQYRKGTAAIIAGAGLFAIGGPIIEMDNSLKDDFPEFIIICAAITSVGIVLQIDSHKYLRINRRSKLN